MGRKRQYTNKQEFTKAYFARPCNRVVRNLRQRLRRVTLTKGYRYHNSLFLQFGCSKHELVTHLESQFQKGMTWKNYTVKWELDHIKPLCAFDLSDLEQLKLANHYTNIRPLFKKDNRAKCYGEDKTHWIKRCYNPSTKLQTISRKILPVKNSITFINKP
jgi:hypothetical protein